MWKNESVSSYATRIQEIAAEILECHMQNNNGKEHGMPTPIGQVAKEK